MFWIQFWGQIRSLGNISLSNKGHSSHQTHLGAWRHSRTWKLSGDCVGSKICGSGAVVIGRCPGINSALIGGCSRNNLAVIGGCPRTIPAGHSLMTASAWGESECTFTHTATEPRPLRMFCFFGVYADNTVFGCSWTILAGRLLMAASVRNTRKCTVTHSAFWPGPLEMYRLLVVLDTFERSQDFTAEFAGKCHTWNNHI